MADDTELAELKARKAKAEAEHEAIEKEIAVIAKKRELQDAELAGRAATADKEKSALEKEAAALKARFGSVTAAEYKGTVSLNAGAGGGETSLMASAAIGEAAEIIVSRLQTGSDNQRKVLIFTGTQGPDLSLWPMFLTRVRMARLSLDETDKVAPPDIGAPPVVGMAAGAAVGITSMAAATAAGAALETASKLGSYLQSNYTVGGIAPTGIDDDLLAVAVVGRMKGTVYPARVNLPQPSKVDEEIREIAAVRSDAEMRSRRCLREEERLRAEASLDPAKAEELKHRIERLSETRGRYDGVAKTANDVMTWLWTADATGAPIVSRMARQAAILTMLENDGAIAVLVHVVPLGGYYVRQSLWTFLGAMPFHVMGGIVASFTASDKNGVIVAADQIAVHSGYEKVHKIARMLKQRNYVTIAQQATRQETPTTE